MKVEAVEASPSTKSSRPPPPAPPSQRPRPPRYVAPPDAEALLAALTLSPATYSRNRFYEMYTSPDVQRTRRRAGQLRGLVTALTASASAKIAGRLLSLDVTEDGGAVLVYEVPAVGMRRTVRLRPIELSLLRYCVGRARSGLAPEALLPAPEDGERVGIALQGLSPLGSLQSPSPLPSPSNEA